MQTYKEECEYLISILKEYINSAGQGKSVLSKKFYDKFQGAISRYSNGNFEENITKPITLSDLERARTFAESRSSSFTKNHFREFAKEVLGEFTSHIDEGLVDAVDNFIQNENAGRIDYVPQYGRSPVEDFLKKKVILVFCPTRQYFVDEIERRFGHTHLVVRDIFRTVEADYHHCVGPHVVNGLRYDEVQVWGGLPQGLYNDEFEQIKARAGRK